MLKGDSETYIYIIDTNYQILSCNDKAKKHFPDLKIGESCYKSIHGSNTPCSNCPLYTNRSSGNNIFYNSKLQQWQEISSGIIDWQDHKNCNMIMIRDIQEEDKNLFYNFTNLNAYDELFELNITKNSYKILYHAPDKYMIPAYEGQLDTMMKEVVDKKMIHPDDHQAFIDFWDFNKMHDQFKNNNNLVLKGYFRKHKTSGDYCWVLQTAVSIFNNQLDDEIIMCFIQETDKPKEKKSISSKSTTNELTGLYRNNAFFNQVDELLSTTNQQYCMVAIDIEHFKLFNDWYGIPAGDLFLRAIGNDLKELEEQLQGIAGYLSGDDFAIVIPYQTSSIKLIHDRLMNYVEKFDDKIGFYPALGVYVIEDNTILSRVIYDRATIALASVKGNYAKRIAYYQNEMQLRMEEEHKLLLEFQTALENQEFTFYIQPKCNILTGKIIGAEALIRWIHPEKGIISPLEFIPILEKNGLIGKLDYYIWEEVFKSVKAWIDSGKQAIPISLNLSRIDIFTLDVVNCFKELIQKYPINQNLIEIEITESAYVEEYEKVKTIIKELREAGFMVSMDDFGSGYSSLNMLKDVNVDILKIDINFLKMNDQTSDKGIGILEAIVNMAKLMGLRIIAEGVETKEQVELLLDIGCLYAQGYYFYRPMPIIQFENVIENVNNVDFRGIQAKQINYMSIKNLVDNHILSDTMLNNILGGVAFLEYDGKNIKLLRVNQKYCKIVGESAVDIGENRQNILCSIYEPDHHLLIELFNQATQNTINGATGQIRYLRKNGSYMWLNIAIYHLKRLDYSDLYYGQISNITEQKKKEEQLKISQRALSIAVNVSEKDKSFMKLADENKTVASSIFAQMSPGGMIGGYCEDGFPLFFANSALIKLLGYESYEEFSVAIKEKVINTIHPDDREQVAQDIGPRYYPGLEYTSTYRMPKKDGTWFWTLDKGRVVETKDGRLAIVSACIDISETMAAQERLSKRNADLQKINKELYYLNNKLPAGYHRCACTPDYDFIYISNRFLEIFDYTRNEIKELFNDKLINMIHPDDQDKVVKITNQLSHNHNIANLEYRMLAKDGYIWITNQICALKYEGTDFFQGVIADISETVELRDKNNLLMKYTSNDIIIVNYHNGQLDYDTLATGLSNRFSDILKIESQVTNISSNEKITAYNPYTLINKHLLDAIDKDKYQITVPLSVHKMIVKLNFELIKKENDNIQCLCILADVTPIKSNNS